MSRCFRLMIHSDLELGITALQSGDYEGGRLYLLRAVKSAPLCTDAYFQLGILESECGRNERALGYFLSCLHLGDDRAALYSNIASVQWRLGKVADAEGNYQKALLRQGDHPEACAGLGRILQERGEFDAAARLFQRSARNSRAGYLAAFPLSQILLSQGELRQGFKWFASRPNRLFSPQRARHRIFRGLLPDDLSGASVLVVSESTGIGDDIFFARFFPLLQQRGARIIFACQERTQQLLVGASCIDQFQSVSESSSAGVQFTLFAGDLPFALQVWREPIPPPLTLEIESLARQKAREVLNGFAPPPHIGLTWRAGTEMEGNHEKWTPLFKEVPLTHLATMLKRLGGAIFAFQRNVKGEEISELSARGVTIVDISPYTRDLRFALAVADVLQHYICVPNTHMHLRLAAGKKAHILEPFPPDWRVQLGGGSCWYPGSPVYRQDAEGSWAPAIQQLAEAFRES